MTYILKNLDDCIKIQREIGFISFWDCFFYAYLHTFRPDLHPQKNDFLIDNSTFFDIDNISEIYEHSLVADDKKNKKDLGKYYTPKDVADFMSHKLLELYKEEDNVCDVGCGCGNLIISFLNLLPPQKIYNLLNNSKIFLYDCDETALQITLLKICVLYIPKGDINLYHQIKHKIHIISGNFLSDNCVLPQNSLVISNPPYCSIPKKFDLWLGCECLSTGNMYALFMEKIAKQCRSAVVISPQSFVGCPKYSCLRSVLCDIGGYVYCFDNVPASIFCGKKKGIFNSNTSNSVRAGITVFEENKRGFNITPLIRFRSEERKSVFLNVDSVMGNKVYLTSHSWMKIPKRLEKLVDDLLKSKRTIKDLIELNPQKQNKLFKLYIPSTPRYFVSAVQYPLKRSSIIEIYAKDEQAFNQLYVLINSSLVYLWWRAQDGEITITKSTLLSTPVPESLERDMKSIVQEGISMEKKCIITKLNSQKTNENVKFPLSYRNKLNNTILSSMQESIQGDVLMSIHSNNFTEVLPMWC